MHGPEMGGCVCRFLSKSLILIPDGKPDGSSTRS